MNNAKDICERDLQSRFVVCRGQRGVLNVPLPTYFVVKTYASANGITITEAATRLITQGLKVVYYKEQMRKLEIMKADAAKRRQAKTLPKT